MPRRDDAIGGSEGGCRGWPGPFVTIAPVAFDPASIGVGGIARCRGGRQGYRSGAAASLDGMVRSPPAGPTTTTGSPRLYSGASRT